MGKRKKKEKKETSMVPSAASAKSNLIVICHGGCGANALKAALRKYDPKENLFLSFLMIETNRRVLDSSTAIPEGVTDIGYLASWAEFPERIKKIQLWEEGLGTGGNVKKGEDLALKKMKEIEEFLSGFDNAIQIGGGGGGTCGSMPPIADLLKTLKKTNYAMLTMPRMMEGPKKVGKAKGVRDKLMGICPTLLIENEHIPNKGLSYGEVWDEINEGSLFWVLWLLKALLQDEGNVIDLDAEDWRTATEVGNYTVPGFFDASKGLDGFEDGLLGNPYLNAKSVIRKAQAADFWFEGKWPVEDVDRVVEFVLGKMDHSDRDQELEIKWGIREQGIPDGKRTVGFVAFAKEGPDSNNNSSKKVTVSIPLEMNTALFQEESVAQVGLNGNNNAGKVLFESGIINGKEVSSWVTPDLVRRYNALFSKGLSSELYKEAAEVQEGIKQQTGLVYDVPTKPKSVFLATVETERTYE